MINVYFIHHSSFAVEFADKVLIFDYFGKDRVTDIPFTGELPEFPTDKRLYFFASHKHKDHFDMDILKPMNREAPVHYILSKDTKMSPNFMKKHGLDPEDLKSKIKYVNPWDNPEVDDMKIHCFRSTDAGVAFYVETNGKTIYHAGDLNWWKWEGAGDLVNGKVARDYQREVKWMEEKIINYAFVVLDPRLKQHMFLGMDHFMKHVMSDHVFPMHMWQDWDAIRRFKSRTANKAYTDRVVDITMENQLFEFPEE